MSLDFIMIVSILLLLLFVLYLFFHFPLVPCNHGDIRLNGGYYYGLVEVCFGGIWSKICRDKFWSHKDASVVCRQLGYSPHGTRNNNPSIVIIIKE